MSVNGPQGRYAPVRGTPRLILQHLRRGQAYTGPVDRLAELVRTSPNAVWRALAVLAERQLVSAHGVGVGLVAVSLTRTGRQIRL